MIIRTFRVIIGIIFLLGFLFPLTLGVTTIFSVLCALIGIAFIFFPVWHSCLKKQVKGTVSKKIYRGICILAGLVLAIFILESVLVITAAIPEQIPETENAVVIVLGAVVIGYQPSRELAGRIRTAASYLQENPDSICIATGGTGDGKLISEAACIKQNLIEKYGISSDRIYLDEESTNTAENLKNAAEIIRENHLSEEIILATDGYHMYRGKMLSKKEGLIPYALPVMTDYRLILPAFMRELLAIPKTIVFD